MKDFSIIDNRFNFKIRKVAYQEIIQIWWYMKWSKDQVMTIEDQYNAQSTGTLYQSDEIERIEYDYHKILSWRKSASIIQYQDQ